MLSMSTINEHCSHAVTGSSTEPMDIVEGKVSSPASPPSIRMQCIIDVQSHRHESSASTLKSSSSGCSSSKRGPSIFRFVSFEADDSDDTKPYCQYYEPSYPLDEDDIPKLWWTRSECKQNFEEHSRSIVTSHRDLDEYNSYRRDFEDLFCRCADSNQRIRTLLKSYLQMPPNRSCRGLEQKVHSVLSTHRRTYVSGMVNLQKRLRVSPPPPAPCTNGKPRPATTELSPAQTDLIAQVLQTKSVQLSRPSKVLARLMAHGDAIELSQIIQSGMGERSSMM